MKFFFVAAIIILSNNLYAQENDLLNKIKVEFMNFEYKSLITDADLFLKYKERYDTSTVIEVYRMKAISHFSLLQDAEAENSFRNILNLDTAFSLDPYQNSPKVIMLFNNIKEKYIVGLKKLDEEKKFMKPDTVYIIKEVSLPGNHSDERSKIIRSLILPGWGHLYSGDKGKGWVLAVLSGASFLSSLYFTIDSSNKEKLYSNETNVDLISSRYKEYNSSYNFRNISIITFAAVWIYSQLDLLLFNTDLSIQGNTLTLKYSF